MGGIKGDLASLGKIIPQPLKAGENVDPIANKEKNILDYFYF